MRKICVAGCSFSDYTWVPKVYGEFLSEKLGFNYIHEGAGCGSNFRIWRTIVGHILKKRITSEDIVIVQYTEKSRREFFHKDAPDLTFNAGGIKMESYDEGTLLRYKFNSASWHRFQNQNQLLKMYEDYCINPNYDEELFNVNHAMFQSFLTVHKIPTIFILNEYTKNYLTLTEDHLKLAYTAPPILSEERYRLEPDDYGHLSSLGHEHYGKLLFDHIKLIGLS